MCICRLIVIKISNSFAEIDFKWEIFRLEL